MQKKEEKHLIDIPRLFKVYVKTRYDGGYINIEQKDSDILSQAEILGEIYSHSSDIIYCSYKVEGGINDKDAIIMIFRIKLPGPVTGSADASEMIMTIVKLLETQIKDLHHISFNREISKSKKNIGYLRIIKVANDEDNENEF